MSRKLEPGKHLENLEKRREGWRENHKDENRCTSAQQGRIFERPDRPLRLILLVGVWVVIPGPTSEWVVRRRRGASCPTEHCAGAKTRRLGEEDGAGERGACPHAEVQPLGPATRLPERQLRIHSACTLCRFDIRDASHMTGFIFRPHPWGCTAHPKLRQAARFIADEGWKSLQDGAPLLVKKLPRASIFGVLSRRIYVIICHGGMDGCRKREKPKRIGPIHPETGNSAPLPLRRPLDVRLRQPCV